MSDWRRRFRSNDGAPSEGDRSSGSESSESHEPKGQPGPGTKPASAPGEGVAPGQRASATIRILRPDEVAEWERSSQPHPQESLEPRTPPAPPPQDHPAGEQSSPGASEDRGRPTVYLSEDSAEQLRRSPHPSPSDVIQPAQSAASPSPTPSTPRGVPPRSVSRDEHQPPEAQPLAQASLAAGGAVKGEQIRERILEATYTCVARWGISKTTVEDAGREAGVSRATVYRYFPGGRDELVSTVISWEYARFFTRLYQEVQSAVSLEEVMERGLMFAHRAIAEHEVLQRVLETEPEVLLPNLTVEANETTDLIADFLVPYLLVHGVTPGVDPREAAEFLARMVLSYISAPGRWDLDDPEQVSQLVRAELLAGMVRAAESGGAQSPGAS